MSQEEGAAERILDAADELFSTRGFAAVSMRDVADQAGVKKASVFYHHGSKSVLFDKVLERYYDAHVLALSRAADGEGSVAERLHRLIDAYLDFIEDHQRYVRLVQMEIASASENLPRIRHGLALISDRVAAILDGLVPETGPLAARHFFVTFSGIVNAYHLYAPALAPTWGEDPLAAGPRRERREHVHWIADALLERLQA
ncbi:MAG: TetR/AcrR family transcriptional regulator [Myxococcales bacterium]|nr:TetR/AcrR family transcriptional regulator [Myxococcales bacterium]MCB9575464.1 TetR/AcrR family transcriptional regulator [Polyangiaceae bacterium]